MISKLFISEKIHFYLTTYNDPTDPSTSNQGWDQYNPQLQDLTKKNGKRYRVKTEDAVSTMSYLNGLADDMRAYSENPLVKEEDWWFKTHRLHTQDHQWSKWHPSRSFQGREFLAEYPYP